MEFKTDNFYQIKLLFDDSIPFISSNFTSVIEFYDRIADEMNLLNINSSIKSYVLKLLILQNSSFAEKMDAIFGTYLKNIWDIRCSMLFIQRMDEFNLWQDLKSIFCTSLNNYLKDYLSNNINEPDFYVNTYIAKMLSEPNFSKCLESFQCDFRQTCFESYLTNVKSNFIEILCNFPFNLSILRNIKIIIEHYGAECNFTSIDDMCQCILLQISEKLLKPENSTKYILESFISIINSIKYMYAPFESVVTQSIQNYLMKQPDTIKYIVSFVTNPKPTPKISSSKLKAVIEEILSEIDQDDKLDEYHLPSMYALPQNCDNFQIRDIDFFDRYNRYVYPRNSTNFSTHKNNGPTFSPPPQTSSNSAQDGTNTDFFAKNQRLNRYNKDLLNLLLHVFGTLDHFVQEYVTQLGQRLVKYFCTMYYPNTMMEETNYNHNDKMTFAFHDHERKIIECLKERFGETHMDSCQVMIQDSLDSYNINKSYNKAQQEDSFIYIFIYSYEFWAITPSMFNNNDDTSNDQIKLINNQTKGIILPQKIIKGHEMFLKHYAQVKKYRKLFIEPKLGQIVLEIGMTNYITNSDDTNSIITQHTVNPIQASIILQFTENDNPITINSVLEETTFLECYCLTAQQLSKELNVNCDQILSNLTYWINQNIIKVYKDQYYVPNDAYMAFLHMAEKNKSLDSQSNPLFSSNIKEQNFLEIKTLKENTKKKLNPIEGTKNKIIWLFTKNFITNNGGSISLSYLYSNLMAYINQMPTLADKKNLSQQDVHTFLIEKVEENLLVYDESTEKFNLKL